MTAPRKVRAPIWSLQAMRGIAALMVAASHTGLIMGQPENGGVVVFPVTQLGWIGVNFFFVLSGFIICFAHAGDIGRPDRLRGYTWRRFSRLYPVYWVFLAAYVAVALSGIGPVNFSTDERHLLTAVTLVQWVEAPLIPLRVAWTLIYEVFFYAMFALLIFHRRVGQGAFAIWGIAILADTLVVGANRMGPLGMWNMHFFMGIGCCLLYHRLPSRIGWPLLVAGFAVLVALYATGSIYGRPDLQQAHAVALLLIGVPFALVLLGGALAERGTGWTPPRGLLLIGDASYSIYLVHSAVISALARAHFKLFAGFVPPTVAFVLIFLASVLAGVVAHVLVERPLLGLVRKLGGTRSDAVLPPETRVPAAP
jgi:exopolysaccharide production protein ExoZ